MEAKKIHIGVNISDDGIKKGILAYKLGLGQISDKNWEAKITDIYYKKVAPH